MFCFVLFGLVGSEIEGKGVVLQCSLLCFRFSFWLGRSLLCVFSMAQGSFAESGWEFP